MLPIWFFSEFDGLIAGLIRIALEYANTIAMYSEKNPPKLVPMNVTSYPSAYNLSSSNVSSSITPSIFW